VQESLVGHQDSVTHATSMARFLRAIQFFCYQDGEIPYWYFDLG
jgi:hypothetical protein